MLILGRLYVQCWITVRWKFTSKKSTKKKKPSLIEVLPLTDKDKYLCWEKDVQFKLPLQFAVMFMFFYFIYFIVSVTMLTLHHLQL